MLKNIFGIYTWRSATDTSGIYLALCIGYTFRVRDRHMPRFYQSDSLDIPEYIGPSHKIKIYGFAILSIIFMIGAITSIIAFSIYRGSILNFENQVMNRRCNVTSCSPVNGKSMYNITFSYGRYITSEIVFNSSICGTSNTRGTNITVDCFISLINSQLSLDMIRPPDDIITLYHISIMAIPGCIIAFIICMITIFTIHKKLQEFMTY
jgi:hypothetical protein